MAGTLVKKVMLQIVSDDGDSEEKIDRISEKADELGRKHPDLKVRIDTAAAQAKLAVLRDELKAVSRDAEKDMTDAEAVAEAKGGEKGLLGRLFLGRSGNGGGLFGLGGLFGGGGGGGGISSTVGSAVEEGGTAESGGEAAGGESGGVLGAIAAVGVAGTLATGLQGLIPMLASAGLGVGAFGAVAYPQLSKVSGMMQQLSADTTAYQRATTKAAKSTALKQIHDDWASLSGPQRQVVHGIQSLESGFGKIGKSLSPLVFKVFGDGLKIANQMLPFIGPLAKTGGQAIDGLLGSFSKFVASPGFKGFMANMTKLAGPSIKTIGDGIGRVVIAIGKLIVSFENPNMQRAVSGLFTGIAGAITGIAWVFTHVTPLVVKFYGWVARTFRSGAKEAGNFDREVHRALHRVEGLMEDVRKAWDKATGGIAAAVRKVTGAFDTVRKDAKLLWDAITKGGEPLHRVENDMYKFGQAVRKTAGNVIRDLGHLGSEAEHWLGHVITHAVDSAITWITRLPGKASAAMSGMLSSVTSKGAGVESWFQQLPGKVGHWLAGLPGQLVQIGESIVEGLIHGIESAASGLVSAVGHIAGIVTHGLAGLLGIHSPSRVTFWHGQMLAQGLALGMESGHGRVQSAAARMAAAATGLGTAGGAGGARGGLVIEIHAPKAGTAMLPPEFWTQLANGIRVRNGDPRILTRKVVLR